MNPNFQFVELPVECEVHGRQVVKRLAGLDGKELQLDRSKPSSPPECPHCCEERFAARERDEEERRQAEIVRRLIRATLIPLRYQDTKFADYTTSLPAQKRTLGICLRYTSSIVTESNPGWLVLSGRCGTGKTMLLSCMAVDLAENRIRSLYTTQAAMGREFRASYQRDAERSESKLFDHFATVPVLLLDELGAGSTEHTDRLVFEVLDTRYANKLPVVIATNHPRAALRDVVGERLFDRLTEEATFLAFDWESARKPAGLKSKGSVCS
jgi:DNA replication protein DnaC